ncbi:23S rRNA (adenine(2503)-C(2))-methyltransferase RlmN [Pendulispora albinea]|uniref:Radical SAM protein n=1 Tax=Pendulispora albinea TaxID=2741071 RepID=A0ABZ2LPM5_9BACT
MLALQGATPVALAEAFAISLAEARKIVSAVHRQKDLREPLAEVRRVSLDRVRAGGHVPELTLVREEASQLDPFRKLLFRAAQTGRAGSAVDDGPGELFETVRIPLERAGRFSVCVSSQIGCALACAFCATGRLGLRRNLEIWEIVEQVRWVRRGLRAGERVHGVVFQGMGEPLANLDRVIEAIRVLCDPSAQAIDARAITVCTSGLPSGIRRLARELPKVRLGLSLGSAITEVRRNLMPIDDTFSLDAVLDAAVEHAQTTGLSPMWAMTLLQGINDGEAHAHALADRALDFAKRAGVRPRLSILAYNQIDTEADPFVRTSLDREEQFRETMRQRGVFTHKRYSGGSDVAAACGQLAARM